MQYFNNIKTLEALRKEYHNLLKINHPDAGGSVEATQAINKEYEELFKLLKASETCSDKRTKQYKEAEKKYNTSYDKELREKLESLIKFRGLNIEIVGCWIWVDGNTFPVREQLKAQGFQWSKARSKWHWGLTSPRYRKNGSKFSFDEIRSRYGSEVVEQHFNDELADKTA